MERNKEKIRRGKKVTVIQGGTRTHDLANDLPCSNQLSYQVNPQLSGWVWVLKAELPGIQPKRISNWHVRWGGCGEHEAIGTGSDFRHAPDLSLSQSQWDRKKEREKKKVTVTQGGTRTHDLANGLPCSNKLSYRVTWQLSDRVWVLKAELPGIQPKSGILQVKLHPDEVSAWSFLRKNILWMHKQCYQASPGEESGLGMRLIVHHTTLDFGHWKVCS